MITEIKKCAYCGKEILREKYNKNNVFCSRQHMLFNKDPKQGQILDHKDTNNFYYLLGLIATDGHITKAKEKKSQRCNISLHKQDSALLYEIHNLYGGKIYNFAAENKNVVRWQILNQDFIQYVESTGICNNKSLTLNVRNWFSSLTKEQKFSFIHGVIDGDGSISFSNVKNTFRSNLVIVGASYEFMKMLYDEMNELDIACTFADRIKQTGTYHITISGRKILNALSIFDIPNQNLGMERKIKNFFVCFYYYTNNLPLQNRKRYPSKA